MASLMKPTHNLSGSTQDLFQDPTEFSQCWYDSLNDTASPLQEEFPQWCYYNWNDTVLPRTKTRRYASSNVELVFWRVRLFGLGGSVICSCGIVCNIIAIIVLSRLRKTSSAPFLLMCLCGLDCLYLLAFLFLETLTVLSSGRLITRDYRTCIAPIYRYLYSVPLICQTCTAYLVSAITLERFVVIVLPFRAQDICNLKWAIATVFSLIVASILYHIPDYLAYSHSKIWNPRTQAYVHFINRTEFGRGHFYTGIYFTWMNLSVNFLLPFALLVTFNCLTLFSLYHSSVSKAIQARQTQQNRLTVMILSMTLMFFLCELMAAVAFIFTAKMVYYHRTSIHITRFSALADTLMLFKSAINFLLYCVTGSKFREAFRELFCCWKRSGKRNGARSNDNSGTAPKGPGRARLMEVDR